MSPQEQLLQTADFAAAQARLVPDLREARPWLVISSVLLAQQAAALALNLAGDAIPRQVGATELLLRAASRDRLPPPHTLAFSGRARLDFDRLNETRNALMHPRGLPLPVGDETLARGLPVVAAIARQLLLVQPFDGLDLPVDAVARLRFSLEELEALAEYLASV
ncbi:MAG: hypothetical protein AAGI03_16320 [Pseudomonadota bacterium]